MKKSNKENRNNKKGRKGGRNFKLTKATVDFNGPIDPPKIYKGTTLSKKPFFKTKKLKTNHSIK